MEKKFVDNLKEKFHLLIFDSSKFIDITKLGSGGFGTVYSTIYKQLKIAVKDPNDEGKVSQLEKEISNVLGLRHVNIPKFFGISNSLTLNNGASLALEFIKGQTFSSYIKFKPSTVEIISHLIELTSTLEFIHNCRVIHRDLKPDNFMTGIDQNENKLYLIDFGLAKKYRSAKTKTHIQFKQHKQLTGTIRYASLNSSRYYGKL
jgi:serine/threonine protein kinase